jgi:hypothetical protein
VTLALAALLLSVAALSLCVLTFLLNASARGEAAEWRSDMLRRVEGQSERLTRTSKNLRIAKAALLAARDAHDAKLSEHDDRFALFPDREAMEKLVEQHNAMAKDLILLKDEFASIRSGAALRKVTGT